ncbi:MAG TPA: AI-2E family transporter [Thermoanaerobaculia bacterium]|nr:AI-2E family transporter [Thermoanaerobaculia bacterium]
MSDLTADVTPPAADPQAAPPRRREWRAGAIIFFGLLAILLLYASFLIIWPFITAILIGAILVILTFPTFRRVCAKLKGRTEISAVVMLIGITVLLVVPALILSILLVQQANVVIERLQSGDAQQMIQRIDISDRLQFIRRFAPNFDPKTISPERLLLPAIQRIPGWVARNGTAVLGGLAGVVIGFFLVLLSAYYFYVHGEAIVDELTELSPLPNSYDREFAKKFRDVIDATFRGQLMTAIAQGFATGIGLAIAGVPGAVFWGAVAALLSLLPMVGAAVVWVPAAIFLYISASMGERPYWQPIFLTIWGVGPVSLVDNVVRPWAMKGKAQLPAIPLLFAVLGGLQAFGFVGLVIGPLVFSLLMTILDIYKRTFRRSIDGSAEAGVVVASG